MLGGSEKINVLSVELFPADYFTAVGRLIRLAGASRPAAVAACNTHIIALARQRPGFRAALQKFEVLLPTGCC